MRNPVAREDRTRWFKAGIWLVIFVLLACAGSNITSTAAEILPKAREYKILSSAQEGFTVKEALKSEEELEQAGITVFSSQKGKLTGENGVELSVTQKVTDDPGMRTFTVCPFCAVPTLFPGESKVWIVSQSSATRRRLLCLRA